MKSIIRFLFVYGGLSFGIIACKPYQVPEFDKIVFEYQDSTVDVTFNRSFTITIMPKQCTLVVTAYGKSIVNKVYKLEKGQFARIKVIAQKIESPGTHHERKPGSSSKKIQLLRKERVEYNLHWDNNYQPKPATLEFEQAIRALILDLNKLLKVPGN
ncbi:hypothetical protein BKI52_17755 [marine bacterium AO1-C]|nr:hypothetical protein BKI52_17755 [marine bacterium AO1-C]